MGGTSRLSHDHGGTHFSHPHPRSRGRGNTEPAAVVGRHPGHDVRDLRSISAPSSAEQAYGMLAEDDWSPAAVSRPA